MKILAVLVIACIVWAAYAVGHSNKPAPKISSPAAVIKQAPSDPHHDTPGNPTSAALFALTNQDREANGLTDLTYDSRLETAAALKCNDLLTYHYFGHDRGQGIFYFFPQAGLTKTLADGENLEQGNYPPGVIEQAWLNSPEHRANIMGHFDSVGFAECGNLTVEEFVLWPAIDKGGI